MRIAFASFLLLLVLVVVQACVTLTKEECAQGDWKTIGQKDGAQGLHPQKQFDLHVASCKFVKVEPDPLLWTEGYRIGLVTYCTPLRGLYFGQLGRPYYGVCPEAVKRDFLRGHTLGSTEYGHKSAISSSETSINFLNGEIDKLLDDIAEAKPEDIPDLRSQISDKRYRIQSETSSMKTNYRKLSEVEFLLERFKKNPKLEYDPNSL